MGGLLQIEHGFGCVKMGVNTPEVNGDAFQGSIVSHFCSRKECLARSGMRRSKGCCSTVRHQV